MLSEQFLALVTSVQIAMCEYFWIDVIIPDNPIVPAIWEDGTGTARSLDLRSVAKVAEIEGDLGLTPENVRSSKS